MQINESVLMALISLADDPAYATLNKWVQGLYNTQIEENIDITDEVTLRQGQGKAKAYKTIMDALIRPEEALRKLRELKGRQPFDHSKSA